MKRRIFFLTGVFSATLAITALAQTYPDKPIRLVIPYPAATQTDVVGRLVSTKLGELLGRTIVVDNRAGAGGMIGAEFVSKAAPDGYTLLLGTSQTHAINKYLYTQMPYDPLTGFEPVARVASVPMVLVVNSTLPIKSVTELINYAKARPGQLNYASSGIGSSAHLAGASLNNEAGIKISHIPYKDVGQIFVGFAGGNITSMFYAYAPLRTQIQSGSLRIIATTGSQRSAFLPEVPTLSESGYPNFAMTAWFALYAPRGTPKPIIDVLANAANRAVTSPDVTEKLLGSGTDPFASSPDVLRDFTKTELERYRKVVELTGAKAE